MELGEGYRELAKAYLDGEDKGELTVGASANGTTGD